MPTINVQPVIMSDGTAITQYSNTVKGTETFTFLKEQEAVALTNRGSQEINYMLGGQNGTLLPSEKVKVIGVISSFTLTASKGTQHFEIHADEVGTTGISNDAIASLDNKVNEVSSQLAQTSQEITVLEAQAQDSRSPYFYDGAIFSIVDDDCKSEVLTKLKPVLDAQSVKSSLACGTQAIGTSTFLTLDELKQLQNEGHDIISHTARQRQLTGLTDADIEWECQTSQQWLKDNGFNGYNVLVYPQGFNSTDAEAVRVKKTVRKYYELALNAWSTANTLPIDNLWCQRVDFNGKTLEQLKTIVDGAIANKQWMIIVTHCWEATFDAQKLTDLIAYVKSVNMPIMHVNDALKYTGNAVSVGEFTSTTDHLFVGRNGKTKIGLSMPTKFVKSGSIDRSGTAYDLNCITVQTYDFNVAGSPTNTAGVMHTIRPDNLPYENYTYQLFYEYRKNTCYKRHWNNSTLVWSAWELVNGGLSMATSVTSGSVFSDPITSFLANQITVQAVSNHTDSPKSGVGGVLKTHRFSDDTYSFQEYKVYNTIEIYIRNWDKTNSVWGSWTLT